MNYQVAYRACLASKQTPRPIEDGGSFGGGSGGGSSRATLFRAAGSWLAWTNLSFSNAFGADPPGINELDLRSRGRRPIRSVPAAGVDYYGGGQVTQLAIAPGGTLTWIVDQQQEPLSLPSAPALLYARRPGRKLIRLDQAATAGQLGAPTVGADHRTIAWTHDGAPRTFTLFP